MTATTTVTLKVCKNKGEDRIWLEGKRLPAHGFQHGDTFVKVLGDDSLVLDFGSPPQWVPRTKPDGRVVGKIGREIVDMNGKWVTAFMAGAKTITVDFHEGSHIVITPNHEDK